MYSDFVFVTIFNSIFDSFPNSNTGVSTTQRVVNRFLFLPNSSQLCRMPLNCFTKSGIILKSHV